MFAILRSGGKQYRVSKGDVLELNRLAEDEGQQVTLSDVLLIGEAGKKPVIGTPFVSGAQVTAQILEHKKDDKITVTKFKRRKNYRRTIGHRQYLTKVEITDITTKGGKASQAATETKDVKEVKETKEVKEVKEVKETKAQETKAKAKTGAKTEAKKAAPKKASATTKAKSTAKAKADTKSATSGKKE